jgi:hypothetical protein
VRTKSDGSRNTFYIIIQAEGCIYPLSKIMSDKAHDSVGTGILPVLYGQAITRAAGLSHQCVAELGMSSPDTNRTKLLATAIAARLYFSSAMTNAKK